MKFWIGDPCYHDVMNENENWDKVLNLTDYFSSQNIVEIDGRKVAGVGTQHGDGSYNSGYDKFVYCGTIGFVEWKEEDEENPLMNLVEFTDIPSIERDEDGTIYIEDDVGLIMIYTGYDPDDYQEDDYGDYDYDENDDEE